MLFLHFFLALQHQYEKERTYQTKKLSGVINLDFSENDQGKEAVNPKHYKAVVEKLANLYVERKKLTEEIFYQSSTTQYNLSSENLNERFSLSTLSWKLHLFSQIYGKYLKDFKKTDLIVFPSSSPGSTSFEALLPALQVLKIYPPLKEKRQVISKRISDLRLKRQKAQEIKQI